MSRSGKGVSWGRGQEVHPYLKRVLDHLPAGKLLLAGETAGAHAVYAAEVGWEVHAIGFEAQSQHETLQRAKEENEKLSFSLYQEGKPLCRGEVFDAAVLLFVQLPERLRSNFHKAVVSCLKPDGGNLYLLAYSHEQPAGSQAPLPEVLYDERDLVKDFSSLQIDLLQEEEETLPDSKEKVRLVHLTAVRNQAHDSSDTLSFSIES